ncbi:hypothetical protein GHT40_03085 [Citrobacter werkmanii]|uniref:YobI family P-loop NTPase n=1 Tax=Citrobacter werkmanii TaxID=67827 RepID=UPI00190094CA|nr:hypothetical protein [Citrobacter werkmanii]MBJ9293279.1 hypothetical protein [Citrobacter werkmanii]
MATKSEQFRRILESIKAACNAFNKSLKESHEGNNSTFNFQALTPINDVNLDIYEDAISFIFSRPDIKNVAISGPYSAGKSSLIESYKTKHPSKKFSHISLSHFISSTEQSDPNTKRLALEGKILNQIIHQISPEKIPRTKFKIKKKVFRRNVLTNTLFFLSAGVSFAHIRLFDKWQSYVNTLDNGHIKDILSFTTKQYSLLVSGPFLIVCLGFIIYKIISTQKSRNIFKKVNLQGSEIEIFEEPDDSYFDKYLNEILYLFENIGSDIIVFEDIDRFESNIIFERLREINTLANVHLKNENKKPIRFFYLLKDDIFISKDRTKFFDYIVPVIPVIDSSNSFEMFLSLFKAKNGGTIFDSNFLQGLSLYVDDFRILKNIYNEFTVYYNKLNNIELDCNKMLAIITYKNIFPKDFSELQLNKGYIYTLFDKKPEFLKTEMTVIERKISEIEIKINNIKTECLKSPEELELIYNPKIQKLRQIISQNHYNQTIVKQNQTELDYLIQERDRRLESITIKENDEIDILNKKISNYKGELSDIKNRKLKEVITRENVDNIFKITSTNEIGKEELFNTIKGSEYFDLLKYLIRNGYIDETYSDYITYFYENSLNRNDKAFLRSISDKKRKDFSYTLNNPSLIVKRLQPYDYSQQETLNFDLLNHLLGSINQHAIQLKAFISQLKRNKNLIFMREYMDTECNLSRLVPLLNQQWSDFFQLMLNECIYTQQQIKSYSLNSLYLSNQDTLLKVNYNNCLSEYISEHKTYLDIEEPKIEILIEKFKCLDILFKHLSFKNSEESLFLAVYKESVYELNYHNLKELIAYEYKCTDEDKIKHQNFTILLSNASTPLYQNIYRNIEKYMTVVLENCDNSITDAEIAVIEIINNPTIDEGIKKLYIEKFNNKLSDLSKIGTSSMWSFLLDRRKIEYTAENIISYFSQYGELDESLLGFIDSEEAIKLDYSNEIAENIKDKFFDKIIVCEQISNNKYLEILTSLDFYYDSFDIPGLQDSKLKVLIDINIIRMTPLNLEFLRTTYPNNLMYFINKNIIDYTNLQTDTSIVSYANEILSVLELDIDDSQKEKLSMIVDTPISIKNDKYSTFFKKHILANKLDINDIPYLIENYDTLVDLQETVLIILSGHVNEVKSNVDKLSLNLLEALIKNAHFIHDDNVELFVGQITNMNRIQIKKFLKLLDSSELSILLDKKSAQIKVSSSNEKILKGFITNGLIKSYSRSTEGPESYIIDFHEELLD